MRVLRFVAFAVTSAAVAAPVSADVTVRSRIVVEDNGPRITEVTEYRKGLKIRTDSTEPGMTSASMILDVGTGRTVMLWHDSKTATEHDFYQTPGPPAQRSVSATPPSITPTSQTREIAGSTCTVYQVRVSFPMGGIEMSELATMFMEGSVCLVKDGPGQADFLRIHRALAERGRDENPMLTMNLELAARGVPFASQMTVSAGGNAPNAERRKIGSNTTEVTSISTESIPDSIFEIPTGYTLTKR